MCAENFRQYGNVNWSSGFTTFDIKGLPVDEPELKREIEREVHEHETFLSWVNDKDAVMFEAWWNTKGFKEFAKWAEKHKGEF
jgi:hypothetical protein